MKQLHILCLFILTLCLATTATAQKTTPETAKKVVVIKKTVNENGETVVEKIVTNGDNVETHNVWENKLHTGEDHDVFVVGSDDKKNVWLDVQETDGTKVITIKIDGQEQIIELQDGQELSAEQKQQLEGKGLHVFDGDGNFSFGGDMILHLKGEHNIDVSGDEIEWHTDHKDVHKMGDNVHVITKQLSDKDDSFDFDFDQKFAYKWRGNRGLNCAALGVYVTNGAHVSSLIGSGGAEAAGIQAGDRITSINGASTEDGGLHAELSKYEPGDVVSVGYDRDGAISTVDVTLTAWTDLPDFADSERHAAIKCGEDNVEEDFIFAKPKSRTKKLNCAALGVYVNGGRDGKLVISSLIDDGGAEAAGLQEGDIINGIDKTPVGTHTELMKALSNYEPGDMVTVDYEREGVINTVQTTLTSWVDLPAFADSPRHAAIKCGDENYQNDFNFLEPVEINRKVIIIKKGQDVTEEEVVPEVNESAVETRSLDASLELADFVAYPNPTDGKFRVEFSAEPLPIVVSIVDVTGKEVFRDNMDQFSGFYSKEINLRDEARGAFILSIEQDGKMFTEQVILH